MSLLSFRFRRGFKVSTLLGNQGRTGRMKLRLAGSHARRLVLEPLEDRRLLSVFEAEVEYAGTEAAYNASQAAQEYALPEGAVAITWQGAETYAMPGQWIAQFEGVSGTPNEQMDAIQQLIDGMRGSEEEGGIDVSEYGMTVTEHLGMDGLVLIEGNAEFGLELYEPLMGLAGVEYAEPNFADIFQASTFPNDPMFSQLWGMHNTGQWVYNDYGTPDADIDAPEAWDISTGSSSVVVAVIDTGVDYNHPDLSANMWRNPDEWGGIPGYDDDGNGFVDDVYGWDFRNDDSNPMDDNNHGTHCAGTIGGVGNNAVGVAGVNWTVQIMALKFLSSGGSGWTSDAIQCVNYARMMREQYNDSGGTEGANIVLTSNSWGGGSYSSTLKSAIEASGDEGMAFVAAAGNAGWNTDISKHYPSSYDSDNIISVAATDPGDGLATRYVYGSTFNSNYGPTTVDLGAPGVQVRSTIRYGGYANYNGTSMATPHVAGVAALAWSVAPGAGYQEIREAVFAGVDPLPALAGKTVTGGRLNAYNTLQQLGLRVVGSSPADGEIVTTPPTSFVIDFSAEYNPGTVDAGDLTVNGIAADSFLETDTDTITFQFATSPVTSQGLQTMSIASGAIEGTGGSPLAAFSATFRYDAVLMEVVSTDPPQGLVYLPLTGLQVNFNEAYDLASVGTDDLVLSRGSVTGVSRVDDDTVEYTIAGLEGEGLWMVDIAAGALDDAYGNPGAAWSGSYILDFGELPYPVPLDPKEPLGSLIYDPSASGVIDPADIDQFAISVDPGQTITVVVDPASTLQPTVELYRRDVGGDVLLASATGAAAGEDAVLQTIPTDASLTKTYIANVVGASGTTGAYTVQITLNAAVEDESHDGPGNDSLVEAQDLNASFVPLLPSVERGAVLGSLGGGAATKVTVPGALENVEGNRGNAWPWHIAYYGQPSMRYQQIYSASEFAGGGIIDKLRFRRNYGQSTFSTSGIDVKIALGYAATSVHSPSGVFANNIGADYVTVFDGLLTLSSSGSGYPNPFDIVVDVADTFSYDPSQGDLLLDVFMRNSPYTRFIDAASSSQQTSMSRVWSWPGNVGAPSGRVGVHYGLVTQFDFIVDAEDWYGFTLGAGETTTLALTARSGDNVQLELRDSFGANLAFAKTDARNVDAVFNNFVAPAAGTYYARLSAQGGVDYSLVVTRNADFDTEGNDELATAQELGPVQAALGHLGPEGVAGAQDGLDLGIFAAQDTSRAPVSELMATGLFDSITVYDVRYSTPSLPTFQAYDTVLAFTNAIPNDAVAFGNVLADYVDSGGRVTLCTYGFTSPWNISGRIMTPGYSPLVNVGVKGTVSGSLVATVPDDPIFAGIDVGAVVYWQNSNYAHPGVDAGATLLATDGAGHNMIARNAAGNVIGVNIWPASKSDRPINTQELYDLIGNTLVGEGVAVGDWYSIAASDGDAIDVETATPAAGPGEFVNELDPMLRLYDSAGNLVASDDDSGDGPNAALYYEVPLGGGGQYFIEVIASDATPSPTQGEYVLAVEGATGLWPPFVVTATDPADGDRMLEAPTQITVDFNDTLRLTSLEASDLTIDGAAATGVTVVDADTAIFDVPAPILQWAASDGGNGHYYALTAAAAPWADAETAAVALGGHLLSINSQQEQDFIEQTFLSGPDDHNIYHVGLTDQNVEGTFVWTSGEPLIYTNWEPGEPNDYGPGEDFTTVNWHYGMGYGGTLGTWNDIGEDELWLGIMEFTSVPAGSWAASDGAHEFAVAAGAVEDLQGTPVEPFSGEFILDRTPPRVVASSIQEGDILTAPVGNLTYTAQFSEEMDATHLDAGDFLLRGVGLGVNYTADGFSYDAPTSTLSITYSNLPDDLYRLTFYSGDGRFEDLMGWNLDGEPLAWPIPPNQSGNGVEGGDFYVNFAVDIVEAYPVPLEAQEPLGGLIHDPSASAVLGYSGDTDSFTLNVDGGQTITAVVDPGQGLHPTVELRDPSNVLLGSATASAVGASAVLQTVPATESGTYLVTVGGEAGTTGAFTVHLILNAAVEEEVGGELNITEDFESGSLGPEWSTYSSHSYGRMQVTGAYGTHGGSKALLMDVRYSGYTNLN